MAAAAFPAAFAKGKPSQQTDWTCRFNSFKCSSGDYCLFLFFYRKHTKTSQMSNTGRKKCKCFGAASRFFRVLLDLRVPLSVFAQQASVGVPLWSFPSFTPGDLLRGERWGQLLRQLKERMRSGTALKVSVRSFISSEEGRKVWIQTSTNMFHFTNSAL